MCVYERVGKVQHNIQESGMNRFLFLHDWHFTVALFEFLNQHDKWAWLKCNFHVFILSHTFWAGLLHFHQLCAGAPQPCCLFYCNLLMLHESGLKVQIEADGFAPSPITNISINVSPCLLGLVCPQLLSFLSRRTSGKYRMSSHNALCCPLCGHSTEFKWIKAKSYT